METFVLAGGCFWCLDAVYRTVEGVQDVVSGYTGGTVREPSYEQVCTGRTGHAEAVAVTFDPEVVPREVILDIFFTLHDPRQRDRQGNDIGPQYRSAMFAADEEQRRLFAAARARAVELWGGPVATEIASLGEFFRAEDYHQDFFAKNPAQGYCLAVAVPKVNTVRRAYAKYIKAA